METLSVEEFIEKYERQNKAVIIGGMDVCMFRVH